MTARCGSFSPEHRAETCKACQRIYRQRERDGASKFGMRYLAVGAECSFCGLTAGNSLKVRVYRYTLRRSVNIGGKRTSRALGSIGICDRCIVERGLLHQRGREAVAA